MSGLNDYLEEGFLGGEEQGHLQLQKAMQAGSITGRDTTDLPLTQEPLKAESLEKSVKMLEYRAKDLKLYHAIPKMTAFNTVEEFLQLSSYGAQRGGFYNEGELSDVEDSVYIRRAEKVKYMQVTGEVTMQAQMVRSYVDAMRQETQNKMMWIMRLANKSLVHADASIIPQQFNSIYKQLESIGIGEEYLYPNLEAYHTSETVIDLRGKSLTQSDIEDGAVRVDANYGDVDSLWASTKTISALSKDYYEQQRIFLNGSGRGDGIVPNTVVKRIDTTLNSVNLMSDKMMSQEPPKKTGTPADNNKVPAAPTTVDVVVASGDSYSKYQSGDVNTQNVFYAVAALNSKGESQLTVDATPVVLTAGGVVNITITPGNNGNPLNGYNIYRTLPTTASSPNGDMEFFPIFKISESERVAGYDGGGAGVVRDRGRFLPNTDQAFLCAMNDEVMSFKELAPLSKLDLAVLSMSRRFIVFQFGTPQVYAPKKVLRFVNCGRKYTPTT